MRRWIWRAAWAGGLVAVAASGRAEDRTPSPGSVRVATFNTSLNRERPRKLRADLATPDDPQARHVAEIIRRVRPDLTLMEEFDSDLAGYSATLYRDKYLQELQQGVEPFDFPHQCSPPVNTGVASEVDLDVDGKADLPIGALAHGNDALGYGAFPGQYGMVFYSWFAVDPARFRQFGAIPWKDQPGALLPREADGSECDLPEALARVRPSSKNHWDVSVAVLGCDLHLLVIPPIPPSVVGPEDWNGRRNHDEIRLWADDIAGGDRSGYLDSPRPPDSVVLLDDLNADPVDGGSVPGAIDQLLKHQEIKAAVVPTGVGTAEASRLQGGPTPPSGAIRPWTPPTSTTARLATSAPTTSSRRPSSGSSARGSQGSSGPRPPTPWCVLFG